MDRKMLMLVYKSWLETRWRFLAGLSLLALISVYAVFQATDTIRAREQLQPGEPIIYAQYIWILLQHGYLQVFWIFSALMLGLGGIWREQAIGSAGFTLALPVTRQQIVWSKASVGLAQLFVLALVAPLIISAISPLTGNAYPVEQSLPFALLMFGGGVVFYGGAFLLSHLMQGEFATPALGLSAVLIFYLITRFPQMESVNLFDLMSGKHYLNRMTFLLNSNFPWSILGISFLTAILIIFLTGRIIKTRDF
jgi:ABC-type transport system involved in multi-copper enzyme maturation permease subunit